jgi:hypothetical protein
MVTREQMIEQSIQDYVRGKLFDVHSYPEAKIEVMDSFPTERFEGPLTKSYVASGFNFDDKGRRIELGSNLTERVYTIEWFIFGMDDTWGDNLTHAIKFSLESDLAIPLLDITVPGKPPSGDALEVEGVNAEDVIITDPAPAEEFLHRVECQVKDQYYPDQAIL